MKPRLWALGMVLVAFTTSSAIADSYAARAYTVPQYGVSRGAVAEPSPAHTRRVFRRASRDTRATSPPASRVERAPSSILAPSNRIMSSVRTHTPSIVGYSGSGVYGYGASRYARPTVQRYEGVFGTTTPQRIVRPSSSGQGNHRQGGRNYRYRSTRYGRGHRGRYGYSRGTSWSHHGSGSTVTVLPRTNCGCSRTAYYYPHSVVRGHSSSVYFQFVW